MSAAIIAEALVVTDDGAARPPVLYVHSAHRGPGMYGALATYFERDAELFAGPDGVTRYLRADVVEAALSHLTAKLERAEARALLERDIAEVERALVGWRQSLATIARKDADDPIDWPRVYREFAAKVATCEAWLVRARTALGGGA